MRRRLLSFALVVSLILCSVPPVFAAETSNQQSGRDIVHDYSIKGEWDSFFESKLLSLSAVSGMASSAVLARLWSELDYVVGKMVPERVSSIDVLARKVSTVDGIMRPGVPPGVPNLDISIYTCDFLKLFLGGMTSSFSFSVVDHPEYGYVIQEDTTGLILCNSKGSFPYYLPTTTDPDTGEEVEDPALGGKWVRIDKVADYKNVVNEATLNDIAVALIKAGEELRFSDVQGKWRGIQSKTRYENGVPFVYCDLQSRQYVNQLDPDEFAVNNNQNIYIEDDDGDGIYDDGETTENQFIDLDTNTVWFPDGTLNFINNLIYDESQKTYYVDASSSYDIDNNYYYTYNYHYEYHIDYTSITYIGQTAEYDEVYEYYYQLPDGRSSADLTAEELQALNTQIDVLPYIRSADDTSIRALYHFDGDTRDSSYWSYAGNFEWVEGASITYMDAGAFNGALYLDENAHTFEINLPSYVGSSDFTLQFRYYQSATPTPVTDSYIQMYGYNLASLDGESLTFAGTSVPVSVGIWQEFCFMRKDGLLYLFHNGIQCGAILGFSDSLNNEIDFVFGDEQQTYKYFDEFRFTSEALYDLDVGYTPTSVPYDTNLALVLPDSQLPLADEYWVFNSEGNLLPTYDFTQYHDYHSVFQDFGQYFAVFNFALSNYDWSGRWVRGYGTQGSYGVSAGFFSDCWRISDLNGIGLWSDVSQTFPSNVLVLPLWYCDYDSGYSRQFSDSYVPGQIYTFSLVFSDGSQESVTFTAPQMYSDGIDQHTYVDMKNGGRIGFYDRAYNEYRTASLWFQPPVNGSMDIVYMELVEGSEPNTGHEFVSSVVAMDKDDLHTPSLAVRTDLEITGYQIGGVRPSLPEKGLVWALVENSRITSLQIYNGQAWEEVDGRVWTGSRWVPYYAYDVLLLKDMWDIVEADPTLNPIYTEQGFWSWLQGAWGEMMAKLDQIIEALGGSPGSGDTCAHVYESEISREATCSEPGHMTYTCTLCGHTYVELIDTVGHDWLVTDLVDDSSTDYVFVDSLDECTDTSKKYVLPDGQVYEWYEALYSIPEGYQQLDYIEATGSQYLDTGFIPDQDTRAVVEFKFFSGTGIYGARDSTSSNGFSLRVTNNRWQPQYDDTMVRTSFESDVIDWHTADQDKNILSMDGDLARTFTYAEFESPVTFILGGINASNDIYYGKGQYRYCELYDNGTLIRQLTPCIDPSGDVGMYDLVNGVFYGSSGESAFVAGNILGDGPSRWISVGKQDDFTYTYKELTCSKCGAVSRDYGDGPEEVDLFDVLGDCVSFLYGLLSGTVFHGVSDFFSVFTDGSLFEGFQQTDENGNTTTGLPEGVGAVFADFSGMISALPAELLSVLVFGICLLFLLAVIMLF